MKKHQELALRGAPNAAPDSELERPISTNRSDFHLLPPEHPVNGVFRASGRSQVVNGLGSASAQEERTRPITKRALWMLSRSHRTPKVRRPVARADASGHYLNRAVLVSNSFFDQWGPQFFFFLHNCRPCSSPRRPAIGPYPNAECHRCVCRLQPARRCPVHLHAVPPHRRHAARTLLIVPSPSPLCAPCSNLTAMP